MAIRFVTSVVTSRRRSPLSGVFSFGIREFSPSFGLFEGNYGAYIEDLKKRKGPDADQPHRIKYKKLVR
jgi:hypothetical protein